MEDRMGSGCPVCLQSPLVEPASVKQCGHQFCLECLRKWCSSRRNPRCPLCQADVTVLRLEDGSEEEVKPPESIADEGPDLSCLDHAHFKQDVDRLLRRANAAQMDITKAAFGSGRRGSAAADEASSTLQQVIGALKEYRQDMEQEVPFDPEAVLHELYALESIVSSVAAGNWGSAGQEWGGAGGAEPRLLSADDAGWEQEQDDCWDDYGSSDGDDPDQVDYQTTRRLDRAVLSTTPGRRPVSGKSGRRASSGRGGGGGGGGGSTPGAAGGQPPRSGSSGNLSGGRWR